MQRFLAALSVLAIFGVTFAVPLYVALTLCAMPCCHHGSASAAMTSGGMAGCPTAPCSIRTDEATAPATLGATAPQMSAAAAPVTAAESGVRRPCRRYESGGTAASLHNPGAPLHVLNSVFRI